MILVGEAVLCVLNREVLLRWEQEQITITISVSLRLFSAHLTRLVVIPL